MARARSGRSPDGLRWTTQILVLGSVALGILAIAWGGWVGRRLMSHLPSDQQHIAGAGFNCLVLLLGGSFGSFVNVLVYRWPRGESIIWRSSHCPHCGHAIRARHNLPVLGWLILRGRCYDCGHPISPQYAWVELTSAATFFFAWLTVFTPWSEAWQLDWRMAAVTLIARWSLATMLLAAALMTWQQRALPGVFHWTAWALGLMLLAAHTLAAARWGSADANGDAGVPSLIWRPLLAVAAALLCGGIRGIGLPPAVGWLLAAGGGPLAASVALPAAAVSQAGVLLQGPLSMANRYFWVLAVCLLVWALPW